jgi:hypothetical protein
VFLGKKHQQKLNVVGESGKSSARGVVTSTSAHEVSASGIIIDAPTSSVQGDENQEMAVEEEEFFQRLQVHRMTASWR